MATCVPWEADTGCCPEWGSYDPALRERAIELAWRVLRTLTGGQVGNCPVIVRPCLQQPCSECATSWLNPRIIDGKWYNVVCGGPRCWCAPLCEIDLGTRVARIDEISVDGSVLDPGAYRLDNGHLVVRTDGDCWPSCQYVERPLSASGTLGITYLPGIDPGSDGLWAAGVLACEFAKACSGGKCRLPSSVVAIARQGVSYDMSQGLFPDGKTGIREVDAFIFSVNPYANLTPSLVWSPDVPWSKHRYPAVPATPTPP